MTKKIKKILRMKIKGGLANPSPPIGPACGAAGINIMDFCKKFNSITKNSSGKLLPVIIKVYEDKSFDFFVKKPSVFTQIMEITSIKKGSKEPNKIKVAKITKDQIKNIAKNKMSDLNCFTLKSAVSIVTGTVKSIGIEIIENLPLNS